MAGHIKPQVAAPTNQSIHIIATPQLSDTTTLMDVNLQKLWSKTHMCYNCQKVRQFTMITLNCLEPCKQHTWKDISKTDISYLVAKAINITLNTQEKGGGGKEEAKTDAKMDFWLSQ